MIGRKVVMLSCAAAVSLAVSIPASAVEATREREAVKRAWEFLKGAQKPDGSWGKYEANVGQTAIVVWTMAESPLALREANSPEIKKAVKFILKHRQRSGALVVKGQSLENYNTSLAILALVALENPRYRRVIARARNYVKGVQLTEADGFKGADPEYGGFGYTREGKKWADMSNTHFSLEALKAAGLKPEDEAFKKALVFIRRCQNKGETNDREFASVVNDGGSIYRPYGKEPSKAGKVEKRGGKVGWKSYGSMTYAMYLGFIYCGVAENSTEVKGVLEWISNNWTLDENPGMKKQGQYYYYHTFAKAMRASGLKTIKTPDGKEHDWAKELAAKLLELQKPDGSWVNPADRWYEGDPTLVTAYALRALTQAIEQIESR